MSTGAPLALGRGKARDGAGVTSRMSRFQSTCKQWGHEVSLLRAFLSCSSSQGDYEGNANGLEMA